MFNSDNQNDNYYTKKEVWLQIKDFIPKDKKIWSPFYGDGKQKEYFKEIGFDIIHEDKDFFNYEPSDYECIIDNPPYSKRKAIFNRLKELNKPFMLLLQPHILGCKYFYDLFDTDIQVLIPKQRAKCYNNERNIKSYSPPLGMIFICYRMRFEKDFLYI